MILAAFIIDPLPPTLCVFGITSTDLLTETKLSNRVLQILVL